ATLQSSPDLAAHISTQCLQVVGLVVAHDLIAEFSVALQWGGKAYPETWEVPLNGANLLIAGHIRAVRRRAQEEKATHIVPVSTRCPYNAMPDGSQKGCVALSVCVRGCRHHRYAGTGAASPNDWSTRRRRTMPRPIR